MEVFKFNLTGSPGPLGNGELISGYTSIQWTERYRGAGEFKIVAPLSSNLRTMLPLASLISRTESFDIMMVENHFISDTPEGDPVIEISGRSFEAFLENRAVGVHEQSGSNSPVVEHILSADYTYAQAVQLINEHVYTDDVYFSSDELEYVFGQTDLTYTTGVSEARTIDRGPAYSAVMEILGIEDLGLRVIRPNSFPAPISSHATYVTFHVHNGNDKSDSVVFSWREGDLTSAEYLWSIKTLKNATLVTATHAEVRIVPEIKYDRRWMSVDASDIDRDLPDPPVGAALTTLLAKLTVRGQQALANQNQTNITKAEVSNTSRHRYRDDYDIGDLVTVDANYDEIATMRVIEYTEIEDETGASGHPTLSLIES